MSTSLKRQVDRAIREVEVRNESFHRSFQGQFSKDPVRTYLCWALQVAKIEKCPYVSQALHVYYP
jgi:hypothetical protein